MWRLEARNKLYQRRSKIIYRLLKKSLITRISKFWLTFDLDIKEELFLIRNQLQEQNAKHAEKFEDFYSVRRYFYSSCGLKMNTLNKLINENENENENENDLSVKTTELSNELLETIKIIENCTSCKNKKINGNDFDKIENCLAKLEKEEQVWRSDKIDFELNKKILCKGCKEKIN